MQNKFPEEVHKQLNYYVYRLIDPRNGETFYIGKGKGNRVFAHIQGKTDKNDPNQDDASEKISKIREIELAGLEVAHIIHRHGMDEKTAFEVEAALVDAYPSVTNIAGGHGCNDFGSMHSKEIITKYAAEVAQLQHKVLLINVNRSALETSLLEATRFAWRIDISRAAKVEVILPVINGLIKGAFIADEWLEANEANFPNRGPVPGRYGFKGREAPEEIKAMYVGKRAPYKSGKPSQNPIQYLP